VGSLWHPSHVIRLPTPPRHGNQAEARESLWLLRRGNDTRLLRADLVGLTDGVEVELFQNERLRRRWRFLTDAAARAYATRLRRRLERRSYSDRRAEDRPSVWPTIPETRKET
jgi:hypothetical protein